MIVSHKARFVFFHNPKVAGTSMRSALTQYHDDPQEFWDVHFTKISPFPRDFAHLCCEEIETLFPELVRTIASYRSVILVRNPYRRFISAVAQYFSVCWPNIPMITFDRYQQLKLVQDLLQKLTENPAMVMADFRLVHFLPQVLFIRSKERQFASKIIAIDGVADDRSFTEQAFEYLDLPTRPVATRNVTRVDLNHLLDNPGIELFVRNFYRRDFEFFTQNLELRHLVAEPQE